ncbi:MAG: mechanosensitive ion channel family protein [Bacteroidota bacterium]
MNESFLSWLGINSWVPLAGGVSILLITVALSWLVNRIFKRYIRKSADDVISTTNYKFLRRAFTSLIYIVGISLAALQALPGLRDLAQSFLAGAGILALAVGFASQEALSNIVAGVFIVTFKPYRVHDRIIVKNDLEGIVEDITLRHTIIRNLENRRIIIPNAIMSREVVINSDLEDRMICKWVEISISYESSIDRAREIMQEETMKHPLWADRRKEAEKLAGAIPVMVHVIGLDDYAVRLRTWAWARNQADAMILGFELLENIKKRFEKEGIEIPYPIQTIVKKTE